MRGPFCLLAGLAIENMLKAIIVKRMSDAGTAVTEADTLRIHRGRHDLIGISDRARVSLSEAERELLARMSTFVLRAGRLKLHGRNRPRDCPREGLTIAPPPRRAREL